MDVLDRVIKDMLEMHEGGEKFFDNLDLALQNTTIVSQLVDRVDNTYCDIIVSGKFGVFFSNYYQRPNNRRLFSVEGGLRTGTKIDLSPFANYIIHRYFIFVDYSFYSGKTRDVIKDELERLGGHLVRTYVIYDGAKERDPSVKSLYRYYK